MNLLVFGWREAFYVSYGRNNNQKSIINLVIISELLYQALTLLLIITCHPLPRAHIIIDFIHYSVSDCKAWEYRISYIIWL